MTRNDSHRKSNQAGTDEPDPHLLKHIRSLGLSSVEDYLVNMVYAIERLLKVLAKDWEMPGESEHGHNVGAMYEVTPCQR